MFSKLEESFTVYPVDLDGSTLKNLSYSYMPFSSLGFGCLVLRNNSFNEVYKVELSDKQIGKKLQTFE
jgi:hypothetical protein